MVKSITKKSYHNLKNKKTFKKGGMHDTPFNDFLHSKAVQILGFLSASIGGFYVSKKVFESKIKANQEMINHIKDNENILKLELSNYKVQIKKLKESEINLQKDINGKNKTNNDLNNKIIDLQNQMIIDKYIHKSGKLYNNFFYKNADIFNEIQKIEKIIFIAKYPYYLKKSNRLKISIFNENQQQNDNDGNDDDDSDDDESDDDESDDEDEELLEATKVESLDLSRLYLELNTHQKNLRLKIHNLINDLDNIKNNSSPTSIEILNLAQLEKDKFIKFKQLIQICDRLAKELLLFKNVDEINKLVKEKYNLSKFISDIYNKDLE